ncbi:hypothetical protein D3C76_907360 [compost metagenome]
MGAGSGRSAVRAPRPAGPGQGRRRQHARCPEPHRSGAGPRQRQRAAGERADHAGHPRPSPPAPVAGGCPAPGCPGHHGQDHRNRYPGTGLRSAPRRAGSLAPSRRHGPAAAGQRAGAGSGCRCLAAAGRSHEPGRGAALLPDSAGGAQGFALGARWPHRAGDDLPADAGVLAAPRGGAPRQSECLARVHGRTARGGEGGRIGPAGKAVRG